MTYHPIKCYKLIKLLVNRSTKANPEGQPWLHSDPPSGAKERVKMEKEKPQKNSWYQIDNGLGPIRAKLMESPRQGKGWKDIVLMDVKGSDAGFFDEMGSVYVSDILRPLEPHEV